MRQNILGYKYWAIAISSLALLLACVVSTPAFAAEETGSVGLEGRINSAPPTTGATITFPRDGAVICGQRSQLIGASLCLSFPREGCQQQDSQQCS